MLELEFVINVSYRSNEGATELSSFFLSRFPSDVQKTGYQKMREAVIELAGRVDSVYWITVGLQYEQQVITCMKGAVEWLNDVEYFKKLVGSVGSTEDLQPVSYGFLDKKHNIRVEFENGSVLISEI